MHGWIGISYQEGFECVSQQVGVDEVNFWQPERSNGLLFWREWCSMNEADELNTILTAS